MGHQLVVDKYLQGDPLVRLPRYVDLIHAHFLYSLSLVVRPSGLFGGEPHDLGLRERQAFHNRTVVLDFFMGGDLRDDGLYLGGLEAAHEPERPSVEGDEDGRALDELLGGIEDGAVSPQRDDVVDEELVLFPVEEEAVQEG